MEETLLTFRTFADKDQALYTAELLRSQSIPVVLEEQPPLLDSNILGQQFTEPYVLKMPGTLFETANRILSEKTVVNMEEVDKNYILFTLTNDELDDVVRHRDEWGLYNYKLALQILADRNKTTAEAEEKRVLTHALPVIEAPKSSNGFWIVICYLGLAGILLRLIMGWERGLYLLSPVLFLLFGYTLYFSKATLDNGTRVYSYSRNTRLHGLVIFIAGSLLLLLFLGMLFRLIPAKE